MDEGVNKGSKKGMPITNMTLFSAFPFKKGRLLGANGAWVVHSEGDINRCGQTEGVFPPSAIPNILTLKNALRKGCI